MTMPNEPAYFFRGRVALAAILRALGVGRGDRVVLQAYTCVAVPEAIQAVGAVPVYADIDESLTMAPGALEAALAHGARAVIVQHTFGLPADMARLMPIASGFGVPVIEDCCHTLTTSIGDRMVGTFGAAAFTSFETGKPVVAGLGGAAWSTDPALAARLRQAADAMAAPSAAVEARIGLMRLAHRLLYRPSTYWWVRDAQRLAVAAGVSVGNYRAVNADDPGVEYRMTMGAARRRLAARLLERDADTRAREALAVRYAALFERLGLGTPPVPAGARPVLVRQPVLVADKPALLARARRMRVEIAAWYQTPVHPLPPGGSAMVGYRAGMAPVAEAMTQCVVTLPVSRLVTPRYLERLEQVLEQR
jgi:perosamine synthetase